MTDCHDPFGLARRDPDALAMPDRVDALRRLVGELQAGTAESRWLARGLARWLFDGVDLEAALGVKATKGSRRTAPALAQQARRDEALLQLRHAIGSDAGALRVLRGDDECPPAHADLLGACRALGCATSRAALHRARVPRHAEDVKQPGSVLQDRAVISNQHPPCTTTPTG